VVFRFFVILANNRIYQRQNKHSHGPEQKDAEITKKVDHRLNIAFYRTSVLISYEQTSSQQE